MLKCCPIFLRTCWWPNFKTLSSIPQDLFTAPEKLGMVVRYLRTTHLYCLHCGIQWLTDLEMDVECPGPDRDDHENS